MNGQFTGFAVDDDGKNNNEVADKNNHPKRAKTVLTFMIKSAASSYCDVVSMTPVSKISVDILREAFEKSLKIATDCGFRVVSVLCDNHFVNRHFLIALCGGTFKSQIEHPYLPGEPLFLIIDPVHTVKNLYNNFINKTRFRLPPIDDQPDSFVADFSHIRALYHLEELKPAKIAYVLTEVSKKGISMF
jgi:hypothetical protein